MKIFKGLENLGAITPTSLTIGNFDGFHLGHQKILAKVKKKARENKLKSAILTFYPHPIKYFRPNLAKNFLIDSVSQKINICKQNSIDYLFLAKFDKKFAKITAEQFVSNIMVSSLKTKELTIGHDFIFGKNRVGNYDFLSKYAKSFNFNLEQVEAEKKLGTIISSSNIREFLQNGEIKKANQFLGREYEIKSIIINGQKIGRQLGFNTANFAAKEHLVNLKFGVYKTDIYIEEFNQKFKSVTNFGIRPTFNNNSLQSQKLFETHILDFNYQKFGDLYHKKIKLKLLDFIRPEQKFNSLDLLKEQIQKDVAIARLDS